MPLYQHIIVTLPKFSNEGLANMFKSYAKTVLGHGGILRTVENQGVRPLPEKAKRYIIFCIKDKEEEISRGSHLISSSIF